MPATATSASSSSSSRSARRPIRAAAPSRWCTAPSADLATAKLPPNSDGGTDASVAVDQLPDLFAIGVDHSVAEALAVSQRPLSTGCSRR
jgi:hypothetical protein